jgi:hypothetical protein
MSRYRIEVTTKVIHLVTVNADTAEEAIEALRRHEGEAEQASTPEWFLGTPKLLVDN